MGVHKTKNWQHGHEFSESNERGERRTLYVLIITAITMVVEIFAGSAYGSMALLADGWHMGTHVAAFMIALFAYRYARKNANNPAFAFGTGKVNVLGGFASATALAVVALVMLIESVQRIVEPHTIHFTEAIVVACVGLLVNVISVLLLKDDSGHSHHQGHNHEIDHNKAGAYYHVLADAVTSLLAIAALLAGRQFGWNWLDPVMGVVGAIIITRWAYLLIQQTSPILLDAGIESELQQSIVENIEADSDNRVCDMHVWRVSANHYAAIVALVTRDPKSANHYKALLNDVKQISHLTIEVNDNVGSSN